MLGWNITKRLPSACLWQDSNSLGDLAKEGNQTAFRPSTFWFSHLPGRGQVLNQKCCGLGAYHRSKDKAKQQTQIHQITCWEKEAWVLSIKVESRRRQCLPVHSCRPHSRGHAPSPGSRRQCLPACGADPAPGATHRHLAAEGSFQVTPKAFSGPLHQTQTFFLIRTLQPGL